jgi:hypothetical protein
VPVRGSVPCRYVFQSARVTARMSAVSEEDRDDDESPWRFAVDEVGEDAPEPETIEPESPVPENVVFVLLGVVLSVLVFYAAIASL